MTDNDDMRQRIEEKRARLRQLQEKNARGATAAPSSMRAADVLANVTHLLGETGASSSASSLGSVPAVDSPRRGSAAPAPRGAPGIPGFGAPPAPRHTPTLSAYDATSIGISPQMVDTYSKECQVNLEFIPTVTEDEPRVQQPPPSATVQVDEEEEKAPVLPPELSPEERAQVMASEDFAEFWMRSSKVMERALTCGDRGFDFVVDYGRDGHGERETKEDKEVVSLRLTAFDQRWSTNRVVTDVAWSPKHPELFLTAYAARLGESSWDPDGVVCVWSEMLAARPEYVFNCQSAVQTAFFNKFSPNLIVGGTYSGQIVVWDVRAKSSPMQRTPLSSTGHTHPIYCMSLVGSTNAHSLISVSTDGKLCVWSMGLLNQPQDTLQLQKGGKDIIVTAMDFPDNEVNALYLGGEEGAVYMGYRYQHGSKTGIVEQYDAHGGPVTSIDFHPSGGAVDFADYYLTTSVDWTCKLWNRKMGLALHSFEEADDYVFDARWSPVHPALFALVDGSGSLELWNLIEDTEAPILKIQVSNHACNRVRWSPDGRKILTGDSTGHSFVYSVSADVASPKPDDWSRLEERFFEMQETQRATTAASFDGGSPFKKSAVV